MVHGSCGRPPLGVTPMILLVLCLHLPGLASKCIPRTQEPELEPLPAGVDPYMLPAGILQPQIRPQGQGVGNKPGAYGGTDSGWYGGPGPGSYGINGPGAYGGTGTGSSGGPGPGSYGINGPGAYVGTGTGSSGGPGPGSYGINGPGAYVGTGTGSSGGPGPGSYGINGPGAYVGTGTGSSGGPGPGSYGINGPGAYVGTGTGSDGGSSCDTNEGATTVSYEQSEAGSYGIQGPGAYEGARPDISGGGFPSQPGAGYGFGSGRLVGHIRPVYKDPGIPFVPGFHDPARTAGHVRVRPRDRVIYAGNTGLQLGAGGYLRPQYKDPSVPYVPRLSELPNHAGQGELSRPGVPVDSVDGGGVGMGNVAMQGSSNPTLPNDP